jgi:hypothetical protein
MRLLLDEHISPALVARLAEVGVYAQSVLHVGFSWSIMRYDKMPVAPFSSHSVPTLGLRSRRAERIEEVHAGKVLFVVRNDNAVVRFPDRRNDHVESTPRSPCVRAM